VVCLNEAQKRKDEADREAILAALREKLKQGDKALIGNRGYRKYLASQGERFVIDEEAVQREARYDGKWVLRTNTDLSAAVQAAVDGGGAVSHHQVAARHPAHLPPL
jgi:hypothetical protein